MKSLFILAGVVMMMLTGCGSDSGSYSADATENEIVADVQTDGTSGSTASAINEPGQVYNLPPVPGFPSEQ